jgi:gamma-glutamyl:cysteine ligase YbdK (ATP-grasp superfamily)
MTSVFDRFTLGIEEEFQIVDPHTRELRSHVSEILEEGRMLLGEQIKPEMIQSMIEVGTGICKDIKEARRDITNLRSILSTLVRKKGRSIGMCALTRSSRRWSFASAIFRRALMTQSPSPPFFKLWSPSSTNCLSKT